MALHEANSSILALHVGDHVFANGGEEKESSPVGKGGLQLRWLVTTIV